MDFTLWDVVRNLLTGLQWTLALSLVAFIGGGVIGLLVMWMRIAVAPTVGFSVQVVKGTAVTSIIGFTELTKTGGMLANATFEPFMVYGLVALGYFLLCYPLSLSARYLERRLHASA